MPDISPRSVLENDTDALADKIGIQNYNIIPNVSFSYNEAAFTSGIPTTDSGILGEYPKTEVMNAAINTAISNYTTSGMPTIQQGTYTITNSSVILADTSFNSWVKYTIITFGNVKLVNCFFQVYLNQGNITFSNELIIPTDILPAPAEEFTIHTEPDNGTGNITYAYMSTTGKVLISGTTGNIARYKWCITYVSGSSS